MFQRQNFTNKGGLPLSKTLKNKSYTVKDNIFSHNLDTVLLCAGILVAGAFLGSKAALYQAAVCLVSGIISEYICFYIILKKKSLSDLSVFASSLVISLLIPADAPVYVGIIASAFAVFVAKLPFGDSRNTPFLPAAAGFGCVAMLFPYHAFPKVTAEALPLLDMLAQGRSIRLDIFGISSLASGTMPGVTATAGLLALAGVFFYRLIRKPSSVISSVGYVAASAVFVCLFPRTNTDILTNMILEISAGGLIFTSLMLINDPVTAPVKPMRALIYGALAGIICMLLRYFSPIYDGSVFSVLIINCLWPALTGETVSSKRLPSSKDKTGGQQK